MASNFPFAERYTAAELAAKPTLSQGQADDLKLDTGNLRYWLSRCGVEDGMPYENTVMVERLIDGQWQTVFRYDGDCVSV